MIRHLKRRPMKLNSVLCLGYALGIVILSSGCHKPKAEAPALPSVTVTRPVVEPVTAYLDLTGTASAMKSVDLVARIPGYLQSINFADGTFVESNQLLFVIEPEPYEQQLQIAQAQLLQAQSEYDRQQELIKQNATSAANVEKWQSERDQAQAQVELAKLNVSYTHVTAPFRGRIGRHLVDAGNMVGVGGDTKLATLDQIIPIYVYFSLNERDALRIRAAMLKKGETVLSSINTLQVLVGLQNETGFPHKGTLDFVDTGVSTSTGTIQLRALLDNKEIALFPGVFARVRIPLGEPQPLPVVPASAIGGDQEGAYVLVLDANDTVVRRSIVKGPATDHGCRC